MSDPPKKVSSLRDRIAAFEKQNASTPPPAPAPRPKPAGTAHASWKPRPRSPPSSPPATDDAHGAEQPAGMSAADAKAAIGTGGSLRERMAALQNLHAFGGAPAPAPKPAVEKPKWKPPPVVAAPADEEQGEGEQAKHDVDVPVPASALEAGAEGEEHAKASTDAEGAVEAEEEKGDPDPEDEERQRRAAIAARMARLGGARVGMAPSLFGRKPEPKKAEEEKARPAEPASPEVTPEVPTVVSPLPATESVTSERSSTDYLETKDTSLLSPDAGTGTGTRSPAMPVPVAPRRAAPPRKRAAKSPSPSPAPVARTAVLGEGVINESPLPLPGLPPSETLIVEPHGDREPEVRVSQMDLILESVRGTPDEELAEETREALTIGSPLVQQESFEDQQRTSQPLLDVAEPAHDEFALVTEHDPAVQVVAPAETVELPTAATEELVVPVATEPAQEPEEEDEEARRKRIAERLAKMGGVNPLSGPTIPVATSPPVSAVERRDSVQSNTLPESPLAQDLVATRRESLGSIQADAQLVSEESEVPPASPQRRNLGRKGSVGSVQSSASGTAARRLSQDDHVHVAEPETEIQVAAHEQIPEESAEITILEEEEVDEGESHAGPEAEYHEAEDVGQKRTSHDQFEDDSEERYEREEEQVAVTAPGDDNEPDVDEKQFSERQVYHEQPQELTDESPSFEPEPEPELTPVIAPAPIPSKRLSVPPPRLPVAPAPEFEAPETEAAPPPPPPRQSRPPPPIPTQDDATAEFPPQPATDHEVEDDETASDYDEENHQVQALRRQESEEFQDSTEEVEPIRPQAEVAEAGDSDEGEEEAPPPPPPRRVSVPVPRPLPSVQGPDHITAQEEEEDEEEVYLPSRSPSPPPPPPPDRRPRPDSHVLGRAYPSIPPLGTSGSSDTLSKPVLPSLERHIAHEQEVLEESDVDPIDPTFHSPQKSTPAIPEALPEPVPAPLAVQEEPAVREEEDPEQAHRRTIAERMAKLGGIRFGAPLPPPARRPPQQPLDTEQHGDEEVPTPRESQVEEPPAEEDEFARKQRIAARIAGMGGMRFGMFPGAAPPQQRPPQPSSELGNEPHRMTSPPPPPPHRSVPIPVPEPETEHTDDENIGDLQDEENVEAEVDQEEEEVAEEVQELEEAPPPPPPREGRRVSAGEPKRPPVPQTTRPPIPSTPVPVPPKSASDGSTTFTYPPPPPPTRPPPSQTQDPHSEYIMVESDAADEPPPPPPPPRVTSMRKSHPPPPRSAPPPPPPPAEVPETRLDAPAIPDVDFGGGTDLSLSGQWSEDSTQYPPPPPPPAKTMPVQPESHAPPVQSIASRVATNMSADDLIAQWGRVGIQIHEAATVLFEKSKKSLVGDGTFLGFITAVLNQVPNALQPEPPYDMFGYLIYAQAGSSVQRRVSDVMPGDIIVLQDAKFKGHKGLQMYHQTVGAGEPLYAVIADCEVKKSKVKVFQANQHVGQQTVESASYRLEDLKSGSIKIYRVLET